MWKLCKRITKNDSGISSKRVHCHFLEAENLEVIAPYMYISTTFEGFKHLKPKELINFHESTQLKM